MSLQKRSRTYYSFAFRTHAIVLARSSNVTIAQTARELGIKASLLYQWLDTTAKESMRMKASNTNNPTRTTTHEELVSENCLASCLHLSNLIKINGFSVRLDFDLRLPVLTS